MKLLQEMERWSYGILQFEGLTTLHFIYGVIKMFELLVPIEIKKVVLNQHRSMLYDVAVHTSDRDFAYVHSQPERVEDEKELHDSGFFDSINYERITTKNLDSVEIINAVKRLKEFFDNRNTVIDRINKEADEMRETVKTSLEAILDMEVEVKG